MPVIAVIGGQWGDEGKGKIVDLLAERSDVVARFSGGSNAGHTVVNQLGEFKLHLIPSGIFHPNVDCLIGNGVIINPKVLIGELDDLQKRGISTSRLFISDRAHLIMPHHILLDGLQEDARGARALGTTRQGIGPAFADKVARLGIRMGDVLDKDLFKKRLKVVLEHKNKTITKVFGGNPLSFDEIAQEYDHYIDRLVPFVRETSAMVNDALDRGDTILLEGAQGTMLDIDFGTYPYVTSSPPTAWGACLGIGLSPMKINKIIGIFKAYTTRVGGGPMPVEAKDATGDLIREMGKEYGTTTGRPRRCGWFDGVAGRFSARLNGFTGVAITKFDVLDTMPKVKICTGYRYEGDVLKVPPPNFAVLENCEPVYEEMEGWQTPTKDIRKFDKLPKEAQRYLRRLEETIGAPVDLVSVGPDREQTVTIRSIS
ncbi:MAG: adenylosuccinate synthase [Dehalococcoidia bacterium]|nr:adenylosuccinate synthase [Dehalococcoidia bacterium]